MNEFVVTINDRKHVIKILSPDKILLEGKEYSCELLHLSGNVYILQLNNNFYNVSVESIRNGSISLLVKGNRFESIIRTSLQEKASQLLQQSGVSHKRVEVKAPMPGMILKINKKAGESIVKGETILILEAMKMENDLHAPKTGLIKDIFIKEGTAVEKGTVLFSIE